MSLSDKLRKEDNYSYYRSVDKLPLSTWLDIVSFAEHGYSHTFTIRLIKNYGLNLCTEDGSMLHASIGEIEESLNKVNRLLANDKHGYKAFTLVSLGGYTLDAVYVKQCEVARVYGMNEETVFPWQKLMGSVESKDGIVWLSCDLILNNVPKQTEAVGDVDVGSQIDTEPTSTKAIQVGANEFAFSGLLHIPRRGTDDWFEVIDAATKAFFNTNDNQMPTKAQALSQLWTSPPTGYGIKLTDDKQSLTMPGVPKPLNKRSLYRRWAKYTAKSNPFKPN